MGKKGNWFSSIKKALSPESKEKKEQRAYKSKNKWFGKQKQPIPSPASLGTTTVPPIPPPEEVKLSNAENEQRKHTYSDEASTAAAADAAVASPQATKEVVRLATVSQFAGKSREEVAAIKIQTAFRGYLARRALRALRGLVRLTSLFQGPSVKRQVANTLQCMQTLSRVQSQIRLRRIRMLEENQALQRQLQQKHAKELETLRMGEEWDDSVQSKEQIETNLLGKQVAAMRRERAMAYSFSHQQTWKNSSSRTPNPLFMDSSNPTWGWSWLERWMAARPWESKSMEEKELNNDHSSVKANRSITGGEINKAFARHQLNSDKPFPTATQKVNHPARRQSPSTPQLKAASSSSTAVNLKSASPRGSIWGPEDDSKSMHSVQSELNRRHSIAGSSVRDDESLASSPSVPSYMIPTESARARLRLPSPLGVEKNGTPEKGSSGSAKKRLSFPASPACPRRHSDPPKVDSSSIAELSVRN